MNILFFISDMGGGGAQRVMVNLTAGLAERGHKVWVAINVGNCAYNIDSRIKIITANHLDANESENVIRKIYRHFINIKNRYQHVKNSISEVKPDVIVTFLQCNMWEILRTHGNIPIIHSEHFAFDRKLGFTYMFRRFILNRFFDKVCVLTPFDQGYANALGLKNTVVMPNPNSFSNISKDNYERIYLERKDILMCGRVNQWYIKGFDIAIEAFRMISQKFTKINLNIVGDASEEARRELLKKIENAGVNGRVHFLGWRSDLSVFPLTGQKFRAKRFGRDAAV